MKIPQKEFRTHVSRKYLQLIDCRLPFPQTLPQLKEKKKKKAKTHRSPLYILYPLNGLTLTQVFSLTLTPCLPLAMFCFRVSPGNSSMLWKFPCHCYGFLVIPLKKTLRENSFQSNLESLSTMGNSKPLQKLKIIIIIKAKKI